jgi:hypothetical protein
MELLEPSEFKLKDIIAFIIVIFSYFALPLLIIFTAVSLLYMINYLLEYIQYEKTLYIQYALILAFINIILIYFINRLLKWLKKD